MNKIRGTIPHRNGETMHLRESWEELKGKGRIKNYVSGFLRAALVAMLVLIQMGLIFALSLWLSGYTVYIYNIIEVLSIIIIVGLINDSKSPSYKLGWICIVLLLPLTGHIMYALWGKEGSKKKIEKQILSRMRRGYQFLDYDKETMAAFERKYPTKSRMTKYLESYHFPLYRNNQVSYFPMGENTFERMFQDIEAARRFILIDFFIVGEGLLWDRMHALLLEKRKQGVEVKFLYDDFGAMLRTPKDFKRRLEEEGIEVRVFNPIQKYTDKLYMNYRSHQKIVVIDGSIGYTGGMNLADEYVNLVERFGVWKDNAVRVEGDAVWGFTVTFLQMWEVSGGAPLVDYDKYRPDRRFPENDVFCHVISDGPANHPSNPIEDIYKQIIFYAKKYLYITTPYLVIEDEMRNALVTAARSGIDVRIITPFIPDKKQVKLVTNYNYGPLLKAGVKIYEYTPGFIHAKTIISEDCGIVGTINMDYRSFYLHYECGVWMCNRETVGAVTEDLLATMEQSREVSYEEWKNRPWYIRIYQRILSVFATLM